MRPQTFDRLARLIVANALAGTASGCSDAIDLEGMELSACDSGEVRYLDDVRLTDDADSVELVAVGQETTPEVTASRGSRCATATDADACQAAVASALEALSATDGSVEGFRFGPCVDFCPSYVLLVTHGDEVTQVRDVDAVRALLGDVDTPTEAVWAVALESYTFGCEAERYGVREVDGGYEVAATQLTSICTPLETTQFLLSVTSRGAVSVLEQVVIESDEGVCVGRRPARLSATPARGASRTGARLASLAHLEAAAIPAFTILGRELAAHRAPRSLRLASRRARADEVRHAREMRRHARRFGGRVERPVAAREPTRALVDVAIENAREGCVREAYGAVVARFQAERATDPALRRTLARIARDEATHAALARRVDAWALRRLDPVDRAHVESARKEAFELLRAQLASDDPGAEAAAALGLPRPHEARVLFDAFEAAVRRT